MAQVLVADDDELIRRTLRLILRDAGHTVIEAADGKAALATLYSSRERLVAILDLVMPRLGGVGVLEAVDADAILARRHAYILITAFPQQLPPLAVADMLHRLGVPVLHKPFDMPLLLGTIKAAAQRIAN
jgi:two-component system response regulator (stage 0 sporulation protein A)